jgi:ketosteroid isomerase-like protein
MLATMSPENVELVRRGYEAWNRSDVEAFLQVAHPQVVYRTSGVFPGFDPEYHGREGMARFRETMLEAWDEFRLEPTEIAPRGDWVVAAVRFVGKGRRSGVDVVVPFHHAFHFRGGLVDRLIAARERAEVLEAAGL